MSVRAVAFADVKRMYSGSREYELKGLRSYGAAIAGLRAVVQEPTNLKDDEILAALLLIDTFEVVALFSPVSLCMLTMPADIIHRAKRAAWSSR